MGNTACCQGQTGDTSAGELEETVNRPQIKSMAAANFDVGMTVNGIGLSEVVKLQAALRGYIARRYFTKNCFQIKRDDIIDYEVKHLPDYSNDFTRAARDKLMGENLFADEASQDTLLFKSGPVMFKDESVYFGEWTSSSMREGRGVLYRKDGEIYEGQWKNDLPTGDGHLIMKTGDVYVGQFLDGKIQGSGKYITSEGLTYEGTWTNNTKHGAGREVYSDNSVYEGEYVDGVKCGQGKFTWPDGRSYIGSWSNDLKDGFGILTYADGKKHMGNWREGKMHGEGKVIEGETEKYAEWNHGRRIRWVTSHSLTGEQH